MGCCASSTVEDEVNIEDLRRQVEGLSTKEEREKMVLYHLTLFEEAKDRSRDRALATLASVIHLISQVDQAK